MKSNNGKGQSQPKESNLEEEVAQLLTKDNQKGAQIPKGRFLDKINQDLGINMLLSLADETTKEKNKKIIAGKPIMPLVEKLGQAHIQVHEKKKNELRTELQILAQNIQKAMAIDTVAKPSIHIRYVKEPREPIDVKRLMQNKPLQESQSNCCIKKNVKKGVDVDLIPHGVIIDAVEDEMLRNLTSQKRAMNNWAKIGLRVQMVQAFNMLNQLQDDAGEEESKKFSFPIISKTNRFKILWDFLVNLCLILTIIMVPFIIANGLENTQTSIPIIDLIIDIILTVDILLSFFMDNYSEAGATLTCPQISRKYILSTFIPDVLGSTVGLVIWEVYDGKQLLYWLKLFRLFRLTKVLEQIQQLLLTRSKVSLDEAKQANINYVIWTLTISVFIFHYLACMWIFVGRCPFHSLEFNLCSDEEMTNTWISNNLGYNITDPDFTSGQLTNLYIDSFYFMATTATTVGYGDIYAFTKVEMFFMTFVELLGIMLFSVLSGLYDQIIKVPDMQQIITDRTIGLTNYLQEVDLANKDYNMEDYIYEDTVEFMKDSFLNGIVQSMRTNENHFYQQLTVEQKNRLVFIVLKNYHEKFFYFFNDIEFNQFSQKNFIRKILSSLDCQIQQEGACIIEAYQPVKFLYLIYQGCSTVIDSSWTFQICDLPEDSYFGEYQILTGATSAHNYVASYNSQNTGKQNKDRKKNDRRTWLMTVRASEFIKACDNFPDMRAQILMRAMIRRAHFMKLELEIKDKISSLKGNATVFDQSESESLKEPQDRQDKAFGKKKGGVMRDVLQDQIIKKLVQASFKLNSRKALNAFIPKDQTELMEPRLISLTEKELPKDNRYEFTQVINLVPQIRQYLIYGQLKLGNTLHQLETNMHFYERFAEIQAREILHMDPNVLNPEKLKRNFQRFLYQKPTKVTRGLVDRDEDIHGSQRDSQNGEDEETQHLLSDGTHLKSQDETMRNPPSDKDSIHNLRETTGDRSRDKGFKVNPFNFKSNQSKLDNQSKRKEIISKKK